MIVLVQTSTLPQLLLKVKYRKYQNLAVDSLFLPKKNLNLCRNNIYTKIRSTNSEFSSFVNFTTVWNCLLGYLKILSFHKLNYHRLSSPYFKPSYTTSRKRSSIFKSEYLFFPAAFNIRKMWIFLIHKY